MIFRPFLAIAPLIAVAGCERSPDSPPPVTPQTQAAVDEAAASAAPPPTEGASPAVRQSEYGLVAEAVVLGEWERAENRDSCAPVAFRATGQVRGAPRPADFGGGWGIAFDLPNLRSAYGLAGPGPVDADSAAPREQRERLREQWPHFRELAALPQPSFAGYGVEGAAAYPPDNPSGRGLNSLAYVRMGEQGCTYNVWSRLGRAHLEFLLDALRPVRVD